jgi:Flp pilus assembly protein TadD
MKKIIPHLSVITLSFLLLSCVTPCFAQFSAESKKMAVMYRDKGLDAQKNGDLDTALVYYQKAMELDPTLAVAYNDAGVIYEARGWNDRAKQAYGKAIELDPALASPYYNLGSIYEKEGDLEKAAYYFKQRVLIGDWNDEWSVKARKELKSLGISDPEVQEGFLDENMARMEAMQDINAQPRGNDLDPKTRKRNARLHLLRGKQLSSMGRFDEAILELGIAVTLDPKNKEIKKALENVNSKILATH